MLTAPLGAGEAAVSIRIDCAQPEEPISPYIYGQFIEHLGRCIYGGIWAEMLEDRKFFFPVGAKDSPWRRVGGQAGWSLTMDTVHPYVGRWAVELALEGEQPSPVGIRHVGLGVVAGKEYVGYALLGGEGSFPVEVALEWPGGRQAVKIPFQAHTGTAQRYLRHEFRFRAGADSEEAALSITTRRGILRIGCVSLMPADNVEGFRADTLAALRRLHSPIYRWPGGNFVSGYDWRQGIGERDRRAPYPNPAWAGIEQSDVGIDEFLAFCRLVGTEPLVVVNTGQGSPRLAADLLEYCNGATTTRWGKVRAANGHEEPYNVRWWGIGNEMYGDWQLGHMPLADYEVKHNETVRLMRQVDPDIKTVAVGDSGSPWSEGMLTHCAESMTALSEHFYCGHHDDLAQHTAQPVIAVRDKAARHRRYLETIPALRGKRIPIALDEWNYGWPGPHVYGDLGQRYFWRDGLGIARGLHEIIRNHDVFLMANFAQTVNVIGAVKATKTAVEFDAPAYPLALYRHAFGTRPVPFTGETGDLDVVAALTEKGRALTVGIVNPTMEPTTLALDLAGFRPAGTGKIFSITAPAPDSYNEPGKPPVITQVEKPLRYAGEIEVPAAAVVLAVIDSQ